MAESLAPPASPDFVMDLLATLRRGHYRPGAWWRFFAASWHRARLTAAEQPTLVASWRRAAITVALAEAGILAIEAACGADGAAMRALPSAALSLAYTQFDAYVHLGLNRVRRDGLIRQRFGLPNTLTLLRRAQGDLLWGHLIGGTPAPSALLLAALLVAGATDVADGAIARATDATTLLGEYLDRTADLSYTAALTLTLTAQRRLPRWLSTLMLLRWLGPLAFVVASYFGALRRISLQATAIGRAAGVAQVATLALCLAPPSFARRMRRPRTALHLLTAVLLVASPLSLLSHLRPSAAQPSPGSTENPENRQ